MESTSSSPLTSSHSLSSSGEFHSQASSSMSGEGEQEKSIMTQLTEKLWQLTLSVTGIQQAPAPAEVKPRKVTGSKTPRDLVEEKFGTAPGTPRGQVSSSGEGEGRKDVAAVT